ncbi:hypothetical protein BLNAU_20005 [Blattamonas nauphoetae]|uniref:Uncharacterized protein n=1 Tax=Blattamonas nauphoetae TaxID=2049346 RepID=A0ABQ9X019_9EUKA|nr:hypothetical protein BLNAU_20005 [Blattamonas nauphoetae]
MPFTSPIGPQLSAILHKSNIASHSDLSSCSSRVGFCRDGRRSFILLLTHHRHINQGQPALADGLLRNRFVCHGILDGDAVVTRSSEIKIPLRLPPTLHSVRQKHGTSPLSPLFPTLNKNVFELNAHMYNTQTLRINMEIAPDSTDDNSTSDEEEEFARLHTLRVTKDWHIDSYLDAISPADPQQHFVCSTTDSNAATHRCLLVMTFLFTTHSPFLVPFSSPASAVFVDSVTGHVGHRFVSPPSDPYLDSLMMPSTQTLDDDWSRSAPNQLAPDDINLDGTCASTAEPRTEIVKRYAVRLSPITVPPRTKQSDRLEMCTRLRFSFPSSHTTIRMENNRPSFSDTPFSRRQKRGNWAFVSTITAVPETSNTKQNPTLRFCVLLIRPLLERKMIHPFLTLLLSLVRPLLHLSAFCPPLRHTISSTFICFFSSILHPQSAFFASLPFELVTVLFHLLSIVVQTLTPSSQDPIAIEDTTSLADAEHTSVVIRAVCHVILNTFNEQSTALAITGLTPSLFSQQLNTILTQLNTSFRVHLTSGHLPRSTSRSPHLSSHFTGTLSPTMHIHTRSPSGHPLDNPAKKERRDEPALRPAFTIVNSVVNQPTSSTESGSETQQEQPEHPSKPIISGSLAMLTCSPMHAAAQQAAHDTDNSLSQRWLEGPLFFNSPTQTFTCIRWDEENTTEMWRNPLARCFIPSASEFYLRMCEYRVQLDDKQPILRLSKAQRTRTSQKMALSFCLKAVSLPLSQQSLPTLPLGLAAVVSGAAHSLEIVLANICNHPTTILVIYLVSISFSSDPNKQSSHAVIVSDSDLLSLLVVSPLLTNTSTFSSPPPKPSLLIFSQSIFAFLILSPVLSLPQNPFSATPTPVFNDLPLLQHPKSERARKTVS